MAVIDQNEVKKEKLRQSSIVDYTAFTIGESIKHKDKAIFKLLNSKNYIRVKGTTTGEENLMLTIKPYLDKDGSHLRSETQFWSNTISEWSYYFEADRQADGEVPENKVILLPINAKDFVTALKDVTSKSFDTMVSMLGITLAATLETNKENFEGYQESLISIGAFKEASTFAVEKGYKSLSEDDFEDQAMASAAFSAIMAYMMAVAKDNLVPDKEVTQDMPFSSVSTFMSDRTPRTALYKGISGFSQNKKMLTNLWNSANSKAKK